jgi:hypothetical protein
MLAISCLLSYPYKQIAGKLPNPPIHFKMQQQSTQLRDAQFGCAADPIELHGFVCLQQRQYPVFFFRKHFQFRIPARPGIFPD